MGDDALCDIKGNIKLYQLRCTADLSTASHIDLWNQLNMIISWKTKSNTNPSSSSQHKTPADIGSSSGKATPSDNQFKVLTSVDPPQTTDYISWDAWDQAVANTLTKRSKPASPTPIPDHVPKPEPASAQILVLVSSSIADAPPPPLSLVPVPSAGKEQSLCPQPPVKPVRGSGHHRNTNSGNLRTDLIKSFPFAQYSYYDIVLMFEKIDFSLGSSEDTKLMIVQKCWSLVQSRFENVWDMILLKSDSLVVKTSDELVDISQEVLLAPS
jgi:hypothetical protein